MRTRFVYYFVEYLCTWHAAAHGFYVSLIVRIRNLTFSLDFNENYWHLLICLILLQAAGVLIEIPIGFKDGFFITTVSITNSTPPSLFPL
jgi:hypothetical protein